MKDNSKTGLRQEPGSKGGQEGKTTTGTAVCTGEIVRSVTRPTVPDATRETFVTRNAAPPPAPPAPKR